MGFLDELGSPAEPRVGEEGRRRRRARLVLLVLVMLGAAAYVALHRYATDRVPPGISVEGVDVGGLTADAAGARLRRELGPRLVEPVVVTHEDRRYPFDAARAGMSLDVAATVLATGAGRPRWSPMSLWDFVTEHRDLHAAVAVDEQRFTHALDALTARIGRPLVEGDVRFVDGRARAVLGQAGLSVDHAPTQALVARLAFEGHPGELPITTRPPYVAPGQVRAALREIARPAMSDPVVLDLGGHRVSVPPAVLGQALDLVPSQGRLVLLVDGDHLADLVVARDPGLGPKPVDATLALRGDRPAVVPGVTGITFDHQQLADGLPAVLRRPAGERMLAVHAVLRHPGRTAAEVRGWQVRRRLARIDLADPTGAAGLLDGVVLAPGTTLHLGARLGAADPHLATALFTAALDAGLPILASSVPRSYDDTLPAGLQRTDVTVAAPAGSGLLITVSGTGSARTLTLWGARHMPTHVHVSGRQHVVPAPVRTAHGGGCAPRQGVDGFAVTVRRRVGDHPVERFVSRYPPVPGRACAPPSPSGSPSGSSSGSPSKSPSRAASPSSPVSGAAR